MATSDPLSGGAAAVPSGDRGWVSRRLQRGSRSRRLVLAACVYLASTCVFAVFAGRERLTEHTPFNHYALLADAWLHGRQDLAHGPPPYAMNNDFAEFQGKTFISFPPFPALLMLPLVKLAGSPEEFRDGQFVIELAGIAPALLFLVLEKLRRTGRSPRTELENVVLAALYAFGTVYFFTAVEGTVWFAAMVVGAALSAFYTLWALDAERPALAGLMLACAYMTRPTVLFLAPLFAFEALRVCRKGSSSNAPTEAAAWHWRRPLAGVAVPALAAKYASFSAPILVAFAIAAWMNGTRYGRPSPVWFDHEFLAVAWRTRMLKWGIFSYHYLGKNLGVALTSLPWLPPKNAPSPTAPFAINEHGLALWFTTPLYLWILWPKGLDSKPATKWLYAVVASAMALPVVMDLLYQNSGWRQFGYRFSNDYSVLLFVLLAIGGRPMRGLFATAAAWSIAWNAFGAATFDKAGFDRFYYRDGSQTIVYQPD
jgi:hypothetical protein